MHGMGDRFATVALPGPVHRNSGPTESPRAHLEEVWGRFRDPKVDLKWTSGVPKMGVRGSNVCFQWFSSVVKFKRRSRRISKKIKNTTIYQQKKRTRRTALRSKHVTRVVYALGTDDAPSQGGVAERRFSKAVTDIVDYAFGVGVSGRRPSKSADTRSGGRGGLGIHP